MHGKLTDDARLLLLARSLQDAREREEATSGTLCTGTNSKKILLILSDLLLLPYGPTGQPATS